MDNTAQWSPDSHWDDHPDYPAEDWQHEVASDATRQSYVEWVNNQLENNEDAAMHADEYESP